MRYVSRPAFRAATSRARDPALLVRAAQVPRLRELSTSVRTRAGRGDREPTFRQHQRPDPQTRRIHRRRPIHLRGWALPGDAGATGRAQADHGAARSAGKYSRIDDAERIRKWADRTASRRWPRAKRDVGTSDRLRCGGLPLAFSARIIGPATPGCIGACAKADPAVRALSAPARRAAPRHAIATRRRAVPRVLPKKYSPGVAWAAVAVSGADDGGVARRSSQASRRSA